MGEWTSELTDEQVLESIEALKEFTSQDEIASAEEVIREFLTAYVEQRGAISSETLQDFMVLTKLHVELGSNDEEPDEIIKLDHDAIILYLDFAFRYMEETMSVLPAGISQRLLFTTGLVMGISTGVRLEEERRDG